MADLPTPEFPMMTVLYKQSYYLIMFGINRQFYYKKSIKCYQYQWKALYQISNQLTKFDKYNYFGEQKKITFQMDSRIYFHQHRRPRYDNPTYSSSNVGNSLTYFNARHTSPSNNENQNYNRSGINNYSMDNANRSGYKALESGNHSINNDLYQVNYGSNNYNNDRGNSIINSNKAVSNLSNYGTNSLSFTQKDVYNKQNQKFDIISLRPKEFQNTIKQYPKYSLENKDEVYYKRMAQQYQQRKMYADKAQMTRNSQMPDFIAGKHTYSDQRRIPQGSQNPQKQKYFSPKMLNHMDELAHLS